MTKDNRHFFDKRKNVRRVLYALYGCCAILLMLELLLHRHSEHPLEGLWGFYPLYGFVGCVALVLVAKWMRTFLMRPEDYYDKEAPSLDSCSDEAAGQKENSHVDS